MLNKFLDGLHNRTCGDYTLAFTLYSLLASECPCCTFYRGIGIGIVLATVIAVMV